MLYFIENKLKTKCLKTNPNVYFRTIISQKLHAQSSNASHSDRELQPGFENGTRRLVLKVCGRQVIDCSESPTVVNDLSDLSHSF